MFIFNLIEILFYRNIWDRIGSHTLSVVAIQKELNWDVHDLFKRIVDIELELAKLKEIWPD
jgi:hypothetical protein